MITLGYGFKRPSSGDKGSAFFPALEDNITQLNDHTHNGVNSAPLAATAVTTQSVSVAVIDWQPDDVPDSYSATVTCPLTVADVSALSISCWQADERVELSVTKVNSTDISISTSNPVITVVKFR